MTDFNPQIVLIEKIEKHPNADTLSIYTVLSDYPIVDKTGKYNIGDLASYICIDAIVPDIDKYHFLCPKQYERYEESGEIKQRVIGFKYPTGSVPEKYRIVKAKRFFGVYSQGLLDTAIPGLNIGDSVVEALNLKKWEEEQEENIPSVKSRGANAAPPPKGWSIPYYDLESVRKYVSCVENEKDIILTEKLNGSNFSACFDGENLVVKSRNFYKKHDSDDMWIDIAIRYNLAEKLSKYPMIVLFGECVNQVKNFRYNLDIIDGKLITKLYCFDAFDIKKGKYLDYDDFRSITDDLGLDVSPILYRGPWTSKDEMYAYAEGMSTLNPKVIREGWVLSLGKERFEPRLNGRLKLKLVGEGYNLSK